MEPIRIALVEDQHLIRQSLSALMKTVDGIQLVLESAEGRSFLESLESGVVLPDIALIDMNMPGLTGWELNDMLRIRYPSIKVIILSIHDQERLISRMINAGACAYLVKTCESDELIAAIRSVHTVGFYINAGTLKAIQHVAGYRNKKVKGLDSTPVELTDREKEILRLVCNELSNAEIAERLFLSVRTVEGHRNNLLLKTGCKNIAGLVLFAVRHGIFVVV